MSLQKITERHKQALLKLAAGEKVRDVARAIGVSARTVRNWRFDPLFKAELEKVKIGLLEEHRNIAARVFKTSLEVVEKAVDAGDLSASLDVLKMKHIHAFAAGGAAGSSVVDHKVTLANENLNVTVIFDDGEGDAARPEPIEGDVLRRRIEPVEDAEFV